MVLAIMRTPLFIGVLALVGHLVNSIGVSESFAVSTVKTLSRGGGRAPQIPDKIDTEQDDDTPFHIRPSRPKEARLVVVQITDVYTLEYFAHFKTFLDDIKRRVGADTKVVCMLTGDFLSPYLLSSVDNGAGMMSAINAIPMDYLTWGNHEADISHRVVCRHVRNFKGTWLNSNMLDHEAMESQQEYDVIDVASSDDSQQRRVGLCAVLSDAPGLYSHFKAPGAFGGATITDPWVALEKYNKLLTEEEDADFVLPLQHLYVPDDMKTCKTFDFPVVLSGHDHHRVDEVVEGTRLLKPGMNGVYATVLDISWGSASDTKPSLEARFVKTELWDPDPEMEEVNERAYDCLLPMRNTELARVPPSFEPLTSLGSREKVCTMGKFICSLLKSSLNVSRRQRNLDVDVVALMGGNVRGNADYDLGSFFSMEALEAEIKSDEVIAVVPMPGWLLASGIQDTHAGDPIPGWMQYDQGITEDMSVSPPVVTHVAGEALDPDKIYRVATKISDLTNRQSPSWTKYFTENPHVLPPKGAYVNIQSELMSYFSRNLWRKLWDAISLELQEECVIDSERDCHADERLAVLDTSGDGAVSVKEIQIALKSKLGYSIDDREMSLAEFVHNYADVNGTGKVTKEDFNIFCEEMEETYERDSWRLSYDKNPTTADSE